MFIGCVYLRQRICELAGVVVTFDPKPISVFFFLLKKPAKATQRLWINLDIIILMH